MSMTSIVKRSLLLVLLAVLVTSSEPAPAQQPAGGSPLAWPPVTNETHPWTRWWWLGNILDQQMLSTEMAKYRAVGIGGLEITPIYGVRGEEARFIPYLSPQWMDMLDHVLREGKRLDMGIDMATGTGWPFGGPWVDADHACRYLTFKKFTVNGGQKLAEPVKMSQAQILRLVTGRRDISEIKDPIESNTNLQELAVDQVRFAKPIPLIALMAVSSNGETLDLTSKVKPDGALDWTAPAGTWQLYATFQGWHGKMVERAGPGGEGNVIDHFEKDALDHYLKKFDTAFTGRDISALRAFFNDSYEVDDSTGESNWSPNFLAEFKTRRGYDLLQHLPALFGEGDAEKVGQIRCDYRETLSDLLLEEYTKPWLVWSEKYQAITRNQAHGAPANLLDLYAASSIPETEGTELMRFKSASSAAHVTGKRLTSAEASTWQNEHFLETLDETKKWVDNYFLGGVNHICYHGTMLSPESAAWPGWMFYASVHFAPTNPFWNDFAALNAYVTRCQSFLQEGKPDNEVLVYFPIHDVWSQPGRPGDILNIRFDGTPGASNARATGELLQKQGYSWDFISDRQIAGLTLENGKLMTGGNAYQVIVVPEAKRMPPETLQRLVRLARGGATVIFHRGVPQQAPGLANNGDRQTRMQALTSGLQYSDVPGGRAATGGTGKLLVGDDIEPLLSQVVKRETMVDQGMGFIRRNTDRGIVYFVHNSSDKSIDGWIPFRRFGAAAVVFDPLTGTNGWGTTRSIALTGIRVDGPVSAGEAHDVYLQLAPGESRIVLFPKGDVTPETSNRVVYWSNGAAQPITGDWNIKFLSGGPKLPAATVSKLGSWTELAVDGVKEFSGSASYTILFNRPEGNAAAYRLSLGEVKETARVMLNGKDVQRLFSKPYDVVIPSGDLKPTGNELVVVVSNLMANRISDMERKGQNYKIFYNTNFPSRLPANRGPDGLFTAKAWQPLPAGLLGPVTLTPLTNLTPQR